MVQSQADIRGTRRNMISFCLSLSGWHRHAKLDCVRVSFTKVCIASVLPDIGYLSPVAKHDMLVSRRALSYLFPSHIS